jgi:hypothetical protein
MRGHQHYGTVPYPGSLPDLSFISRLDLNHCGHIVRCQQPRNPATTLNHKVAADKILLSVCDNTSLEVKGPSIDYDPTTADDLNPTDDGDGTANDGTSNGCPIKEPVVLGNLPNTKPTRGSLFSNPGTTKNSLT